MSGNLTIACADIGSVKSNNFGWAYLEGSKSKTGMCMVSFVDEVASSLENGQKVALGFECPLWIPVSSDPINLTKGRKIDGNKPWSAGAGTAVLTTGLTQVAWILENLKSQLSKRKVTHPFVYLDWSEFLTCETGIFIWEAFVTGKAKGTGHIDDALIACREFKDRFPDPTLNFFPEEKVRSLIGGAILWSGWSSDLDLLHKPCIVIRPDEMEN